MENPNILDDVFENFVKGAKLFKDREVLRHDYLPDRLPHRESQIRLLGGVVAPVFKMPDVPIFSFMVKLALGKLPLQNTC